MNRNRMKILNQIPNNIDQHGNKFWNFLEKDNETAELQLFGEISSEEDWWSEDCVTYRNFINDLNALGDKKCINVVIQSCGGDVFAANAIYNALIMNKAEITGTVIGICASAATIILMACKTRKIAKNAIFMIHNPSISLFGGYTSEDLNKLSASIDQVKNSILEAYTQRCGKTKDEISKLMDDETWMVGQEAVDAGFCDEVIGSGFDESISNKWNMSSFKNYLEKEVPENVKEKVRNLSETKVKPILIPNFQNISQKEGNEMGATNQTKQAGTPVQIISDAEQLKNAYPDFVNQIISDAVKQERERLKAIDEIANGINPEILKKAKYEEPMSAADLALAQMKANNSAGQTAMNNIIDDLQNSGASDVTSVPNSGNNPEDEAKEKREEKVNRFSDVLKRDKRRKGDK